MDNTHYQCPPTLNVVCRYILLSCQTQDSRLYTTLKIKGSLELKWLAHMCTCMMLNCWNLPVPVFLNWGTHLNWETQVKKQQKAKQHFHVGVARPSELVKWHQWCCCDTVVECSNKTNLIVEVLEECHQRVRQLLLEQTEWDILACIMLCVS